MASGTEIVRSIDKFPHRDFSLNFIHDIERVFVGIGMCNSDDLFFRFCDIVTDERDELVQRSFSSAALLVLDHKTVFVSAQARFDTQKVADESSCAAQTSGSGKIF